ncbi:MAG: SsrA-binding protein SmpB [Pigeon pea little leaf phytoplasma]|uniref:SsrA-binding protein n=1 Tax=Candidatus Phytoplasma fabacearum TaxID=2982628 RepID=A0ABU8ZSU2_9MOLU|nr:SsrA-binding protein SmpB ['Bituminaria bituminosa' little leaf phytoplasma]MDV3148747.1 SsrA-binding protein SmpB [Pigeon pea little leaf phytoplasma]MDO7983639.1 SsrA-binding protein SmpB ['Bituminaria bituminosa' little leaf phytoplasma]MDO8024038.1 SsrA-binding protein SmpB ['Bituminaria bituminosa' little leaf phytoplasma]MDO8030448.1 SsrA-binding protein SmpB ['Bituminaria bituminosa' little leaf phytoplasma]MDV3154213.1 SsrA-binding protein SmpB [Pigeon pea little leaf phytoplasma]
MKQKVIFNKKANYDYFLDKKYSAGIQLLGNEVKSIRLGQVHLDNSYVCLDNNELFVINMKITKYSCSNDFDHIDNRKKKLLLKKKEILQIKNKIKTHNFVLIPIKIFNQHNLFKLEIALARGKKKYDKRQDLKHKDELMYTKKILKEFI